MVARARFIHALPPQFSRPARWGVVTWNATCSIFFCSPRTFSTTRCSCAQVPWSCDADSHRDSVFASCPECGSCATNRAQVDLGGHLHHGVVLEAAAGVGERDHRLSSKLTQEHFRHQAKWTRDEKDTPNEKDSACVRARKTVSISHSRVGACVLRALAAHRGWWLSG